MLLFLPWLSPLPSQPCTWRQTILPQPFFFQLKPQHIVRVPKSFSYKPTKHKVGCFSDPRNLGSQKYIAVK